ALAPVVEQRLPPALEGARRPGDAAHRGRQRGPAGGHRPGGDGNGLPGLRAVRAVGLDQPTRGGAHARRRRRAPNRPPRRVRPEVTAPHAMADATGPQTGDEAPRVGPETAACFLATLTYLLARAPTLEFFLSSSDHGMQLSMGRQVLYGRLPFV